MASNDNYNNETIEKIRNGLEINTETNCALIFAYNGTGKTRLSYDFAHYGRKEGDSQHTLYYNAYTEDLFSWDNDTDSDTGECIPKLVINKKSALIKGLAGYDITADLYQHLQLFTDINFKFCYGKIHEEDIEKEDATEENEEESQIPSYVIFNKVKKVEVIEDGEKKEKTIETSYFKISRGEERLFVWSFFRCIMNLVIKEEYIYKDIEYIYIDDPISSLDDNNVIAFAAQLYNLINDTRKDYNMKLTDNNRPEDETVRRIKFIISSHHALFFHVMAHGLNDKKQKPNRYFLSRDRQSNELTCKDMSDNTPFYYNVAMMYELKKAIDNDQLRTYHFTIMRSVMEKIKEFFGHPNFARILHGITYMENKFDEPAFNRGELTDLYSRLVNVFSHQGSFYAPVPPESENKILLETMFNHIMRRYRFELPNLEDERSEREIYQANQQNNQNRN